MRSTTADFRLHVVLTGEPSEQGVTVNIGFSGSASSAKTRLQIAMLYRISIYS